MAEVRRLADVDSHPLSWPSDRPRTIERLRRRADWYGEVQESRTRLGREADHWKIRHWVLSTDLSPGMRATTKLADPGAAFWFVAPPPAAPMLCVIAADLYEKPTWNIRAIELTLARLRLATELGVLAAEQVLRGLSFEPLPAPGGVRPWREVLDLPGRAPPTAAEVEEAYRRLARLRHPDAGGSDGAMAELNAAREEARRAAGAAQG